MSNVGQVCDYLEQIAPGRLAAEWDNVGLLVGDVRQPVQRIMTCLTITPTTAAEAIEGKAELIVTHHPLPFRALKRLTSQSTAGRLLWLLIGARISIYSPHTAWDSATTGINQQLAEGVGLSSIKPLEPIAADPDGLGSGRVGDYSPARSFDELLSGVRRFLNVDGVHVVGDRSEPVARVGIACGSAGEFLPVAARLGCDVLLTGETSFHTCLEAEAIGVRLILPGHFASERFSLERLAERLQQQFADVDVWASRREVDPLVWNGVG